MLRAPAAPAPIATKNIEMIALKNEIDIGDVNKPTVHVKITSDITLGFINNRNDFKLIRVLLKIDLLFIILLVTFTQH